MELIKKANGLKRITKQLKSSMILTELHESIDMNKNKIMKNDKQIKSRETQRKWKDKKEGPQKGLVTDPLAFRVPDDPFKFYPQELYEPVDREDYDGDWIYRTDSEGRKLTTAARVAKEQAPAVTGLETDQIVQQWIDTALPQKNK